MCNVLDWRHVLGWGAKWSMLCLLGHEHHQRLQVATFASGELQLRGENLPCKPARLRFNSPSEAVVSLTEGRYHQVRRMLAACGSHVAGLHRSRVGHLTVDGLPEGQYTTLERGEFEAERGIDEALSPVRPGHGMLVEA